MQAAPAGSPGAPPMHHNGMATSPSQHSSDSSMRTLNTAAFTAGIPPPPSSRATHPHLMLGTGSGIHDPMSMSEPMLGGSRSPSAHGSMAAMSAQKRAYRQRRKDPSCDACRERKVKCDATDATSCSECSARSVKCQFTKETNRRMSSMKQVQDLERQLQQAKQQILQLKSLIPEGGTPTSASAGTPVPTFNNDISHFRDRTQLPRLPGGFFKVRRNIRNYGRGIFKPPHVYRTPGIQHLFPNDGPALPPRPLVEHLLRQYRAVLHPFQPVLHWPTFMAEVEDMYRAGSCKGVRKTTIGVFFAVLACASLVTDEPLPETEALGWLDISSKQVNTLSDVVTVDNARTALMISLYFMETNRTSAAWTWLGAGLRSAQEAGLHLEQPNVGPMQAELCKRTWWAIYTWDRLCSLELGSLDSHEGIDPNVEIGEPTPIDDDYIKLDGFQTLDPANKTPNMLLALIPVVRLIHQLKRTLRTRVISAANLKIYEEHFDSVMESYPDPYPLGSSTPLDPFQLHAPLVLQICKFMLYRQNLTPACKAQERQEALARCVQVARDTAHYVWRSTPTARTQHARIAIHPPDVNSPEWQARIRHATPSITVKHWWRCILVLCLTADFGPALTLLGALKNVGKARKVGVACGRNLAFFLETMIHKLQTERGVEMESDEEMLAYASGDLQGISHCAWAWANGDANASGQATSPVQMDPPAETFEHESTFLQPVLLTEHEEREWGGFGRLEDMVRHLQHLRGGPRSAGQISSSHYGSPEEPRAAAPRTPDVAQFSSQSRNSSLDGFAPPSHYHPYYPSLNSNGDTMPPHTGRHAYSQSTMPPHASTAAPAALSSPVTTPSSTLAPGSNPVTRISIKDIM